jgi:hypothetical protein
MKNNLKLIIAGFIIWGAFYLTGNGINVARNREVYLPGTSSYKNDSELKESLEQEKRKLGLENIVIEVEEDPGRMGGWCRKTRENQFLIRLGPNFKNKKILRHELYHIKNWDKFNFLNAVTLGNYEEWNATSYSLEE